MRFYFKVAWRSLLRQRRRTLITASAMAVGVAMVMGMLAYVDGMFALMFDKMVGQSMGHVQIHHPAYPDKHELYDTVGDATNLLAAIDATPGVKGAAPRLFAYGLVGGKADSTGVRLQGIDPADELAVTGFGGRVAEGVALGGPPPEDGSIPVVIGVGLGKSIKVGVGDSLVLITQAADGALANELLTVVGVVKTGSTAMDRAGAWVPLADLQRVLALDDKVHEVLILGDDSEMALALADTVAAAAGGSRSAPAEATAAAPVEGGEALPVGPLVRTWFEADPATAKLMESQTVPKIIMLAVVFSVAALGVLNTMLMSVFERTRELGLLKALGLKPRQIVTLILAEAAMLGGLSSALGLALGLLLDWYLVVYGIPMADSDGEGFAYMGITFDPVIYGKVLPEGIIMSVSSVLIVCVLAAVWPAIRAARLRPVDAMRQT
jgi:putative ABC transport system permease protein